MRKREQTDLEAFYERNAQSELQYRAARKERLETKHDDLFKEYVNTGNEYTLIKYYDATEQYELAASYRQRKELERQQMKQDISSAFVGFAYTMWAGKAAANSMRFDSGAMKYEQQINARIDQMSPPTQMRLEMPRYPLQYQTPELRLSQPRITRPEPQKSFSEQMTATEAARYQKYWRQQYHDYGQGTRFRDQAPPGTRSIIDQKLSSKVGQASPERSGSRGVHERPRCG